MKASISLLRKIRFDREVQLILAVSALAFLFKLYLLSKRSLYIDPDEGYYLVLARNIAHGKGYGFNGLPNIIFPPVLPLAIALVHFLVHDFQTSLNVITALSGTLLGLIVYRIARNRISLGAGFGCFLLALFSQELNAFLPAALRYSQVLYRGSDILNCCLVLASAYFLIRLAEKDSYPPAVFAGFFLAMAYLTRPEGFILFAGFLALLVLLKSFSWVMLSWKRIISLALVFLALACPYILYLKSVTGRWMLSGKISASQKYRAALLQVIQKEDWGPFNRSHYSLNSHATEMNDLYFGYHENSDREQDVPADPPGKIILSNLRHYGIIPRTLIPWQLLPFVLLGLGSALLLLFKKRSLPDILLLSLVPYSLAIEALSYPIPRHHLFLVPIAILYGGRGAFLLSSWAARKNKAAARRILGLIFAVLVALAANDQLVYSGKNLLNNPVFRSSRRIEFSAARRLKEARAEVVMSSHPNLAVWASSDWQVLPQSSLPAQIEFGKNKRVDYAILTTERRPFFHILDFRNSRLPERPGDPFDIQVVENDDHYDIIRVMKRE